MGREKEGTPMTHRQPTPTYTYKVVTVVIARTLQAHYQWTVYEDGKPFQAGQCKTHLESDTIGKAKAAFWNQSETAALDFFGAIGDALDHI